MWIIDSEVDVDELDDPTGVIVKVAGFCSAWIDCCPMTLVTRLEILCCCCLASESVSIFAMI